MGQCKYYHEDWLGDRCYGTKECELCNCGGDEVECDFYPEKRNKNTMKYDIKIGDYVETTDGIMGYVSSIEEHKFNWIVTNQNNVSCACEVGEETCGGFNTINLYYNRVGKYDFRPTETEKNVIEPLEDRGSAYMNYNTTELYKVYNKVNEIIEWINRSEKDA